MTALVEAFTHFYAEFTAEKLPDLHEIYDARIVFEDPIHKVQGLPELRTYFGATMSGLNFCRFEFDKLSQVDDQLFTQWTMHYSHPKLKKGAHLQLPGMSILTLGEKITSHRDYYDMGAMLYEHVPLLRMVIKGLKHRLAGERERAR